MDALKSVMSISGAPSFPYCIENRELCASKSVERFACRHSHLARPASVSRVSGSVIDSAFTKTRLFSRNYRSAGRLAPRQTAFGDDYVLVSNDPEEVKEEVRRIELENEELRKKLDELNRSAAAVAKERQETIDPSRIRIGAQAPVSAESLAATASEVVPPSPVAFKEAPVPAPAEKTPVVTPAPTKAPTKTAPATSPAKPTSSTSTTTTPTSTLASDRNAALDSSRLTRDQEVEKPKATTPISIVFVASEVAPYSKTGGLADVVGSLPFALAERGHRVMVVSPRYMNGVTDKLYAGATDSNCRIKLPIFFGEHEVAFFHEFKNGVDYVFVDHPSYHRPGNPYGDSRGTFGDNQFRFTLLSMAACEAPLVLPLGGYTYGEKCLFVANDWHAGLVPLYLAAKYRPFGVHKGSRCILAIHNLMHQGVEPGVTFGNLGLPGEWYGALEWVFPTWARAHALDKGEAVNVLKGAIVTADRILTVSQGYAWEIQTVEGGWGLDGLLQGRNFVLNGITNGIDIAEWNPASDPHVPSQYSIEDVSGKAECKAALQKELGLPVRADVPLIGFIGRLDYQKGPDIIQAGLPELMTDDVQMIMLGSGDTAVESWMAWAEGEYRDKFRGWVGFSVPVAHRITAGCDILLMPSRFEPCGLNQLYAMRYGTIPVAHATGGLRDTIEDFNPFAAEGEGRGTGWTFSPLSKEAMMSALWNSIHTYRTQKPSWEGLMKRAMAQDFSWERAALQYEQVFEWAMLDSPYA